MSSTPPSLANETPAPQNRRRTIGCLIVGIVLLFGGCVAVLESNPSEEIQNPSATDSSAPAEVPASPGPSGGDVTEEFLASQWGQQFQGIVMDVDQEFTEDGTTMRLDADTNLTSPQDAAQAVEICEALKSAFRNDWGKFFYVRVNETNGTVFLTNQGGCDDPRAQ